MHDLPIAIVGAGPAGASAALTLARGGCKNVTLFERSSWPRGKACAGGLGPRALTWLNHVGLSETIVPHTRLIEGLHFTGPAGNSSYIATPGTVARVIPRSIFDNLLVEQAIQAGAHFCPDTKILDIKQNAAAVEITSSAGQHEYALALIASGATGTPKGITLPPHRDVRSIMARFRNLPHDPSCMEMIFARAVSPYYIWLFPEPDGAVNLGLLTDASSAAGSLHKLFDEILERFFSGRIDQATLEGKRMGAPLHVSAKVGPVADRRILLVGEAAGLVNAATGEGIPWALESGDLAASEVLRALSDYADFALLAANYQGALSRSMNWRLYAAHWSRRLIGGPLFAPMTRLATTRLAKQFSAQLFSKV